MRATLERIEVPDAELARARAHAVVLAAFDAREPLPRRQHRLRAVGLAAAALALVGAALATPPGRAVLGELREAVGVERAQPALFGLPTAGQLLVSTDAGAWVVQPDGSKRLLGAYREASWSPFGRFVVAARRNELVAVEPDGDIRWTLGRRDVRFPRWAGTESDTRIAYLSAGELRVVGGDGVGDRRVQAHVSSVPPAWRPGGFVLTYVDRFGSLVTKDVARDRILWRRPGGPPILGLEWSADGRRLVVRRGETVDVLTRDGRPFTAVRSPGAAVTASALRPPLHESTHALARGARSQVLHVGEGGGRLFAAAGRFSQLVWSPDGSWLLVAWPEADQWVFVRADGKRIRAVANVAEQLRTRSFPRIEGWCC